MEIASDFAHVIQLLIQDPQKFNRNRASQRSTTERRAVHAGVHAGSHPITHQNCSERKPPGKRFRNGHNVRLDVIVLISEITSSPPQSRLNLVKNQQSVAAFRQFSCELQKLWFNWTNSAFALNRLQDRKSVV